MSGEKHQEPNSRVSYVSNDLTHLLDETQKHGVSLTHPMTRLHFWSIQFQLLQQDVRPALQQSEKARLLVRRLDGSGRGWQDVGPANGVRALASSDSWIFALRTDGSIFRREDGLNNSIWQFLTRVPNAVAMTAFNDRLYIADRSGNIVWRPSDPSDGGWRLLIKEPSTVAMTAGVGALWISKANGEFSRIDLDTKRVQRIGSASNIAELGFNNGRLYAVRRDGRIWERPAVIQNAKWNAIARKEGAVAISLSGSEIYIVAK